MGDTEMDIMKRRVSASLTVEASFIMGILLIIILYQITFIMGLYGRVADYSEKCTEEITATRDAVKGMRATRMGLEVLGKEHYE